MFHDINRQKNADKNLFLKEIRYSFATSKLNYVITKIYRSTALAMRCMIFGGDPVLGSPFYLAWPHRLRIK